MKILLISDAWKPQINGVVRTLETTLNLLQHMGHEVQVVGPDLKRFCTVGVPFYREIKLEFFANARLSRLMRSWNPDFIHIATEGPLGWTGRRLCLQQGRPFTTSYHTRFPEYLAARVPRPFARLITFATYAFLRRFHTPAGLVMVSTLSLERELKKRRFYRLARWSRGVDTQLFRPYGKAITTYEKLPRPLLLYVGRVAVEKNLREFLDLKTTGSKIVIGDGPDRTALHRDYPQAHFLGVMKGEALARHYAAADLFVFPSKTDTFGLVLLEACAAGLRIAALPAPGPSDIFTAPECKDFVVLNNNLQTAVDQALTLPDDPQVPHSFAVQFSWEACARQFFTNLQAPSPRAKKRLARWRKKIGVDY